MKINWKATLVIVIDVLLVVYLIFAVTMFNSLDDNAQMCTKVDIDIKQGAVEGFLNEDEIRTQLQRAKIYPLVQPMQQVNTRKIEEMLIRNPFVEDVECYKAQDGRVVIMLTQKLPLVHVKADNGDDYYIDTDGHVMPTANYSSNLVVATGSISRDYARKMLAPVGNFLLQDSLWLNQVEQLHILPDGTMEMIPRVGEHVVYLGRPTNLRQKLSRLEMFYKYGLSQAGWNKYSYICLEYENQIVCRKCETQQEL